MTTDDDDDVIVITLMPGCQYQYLEFQYPNANISQYLPIAMLPNKDLAGKSSRWLVRGVE